MTTTVRDAAGAWTSGQAGRVVAYTKAVGGDLAAAELFNEPTVPSAGGAPPGYDAAAFARDIAAIWLTETAEAACGGNPWATTFRDSFRYLYRLGQLAKQGVQAVMHNTLTAITLLAVPGAANPNCR